MITIRDQFVVAKPALEVWAFLERFDDLARCVPSLKEWSLDGDRILGKVGVTLGVVPVESKVRLEITQRTPPCCIEARGASFLGETITGLRGGKEGQIRAADSGQIVLHLDVRAEGPDRTRLLYIAGVEADGRLRKIYESIMKLKVPAMKREFAHKVSLALGVEVLPADGDDAMCSRAEEIPTVGLDRPAAAEPPAAARALVPAATTPAAPATPRASAWSRLRAWLRGLWRRLIRAKDESPERTQT